MMVRRGVGPGTGAGGRSRRQERTDSRISLIPSSSKTRSCRLLLLLFLTSAQPAVISEPHSACEDARKAHYGREAHDLLQRLQLVSGHNDLISRNKIGTVRSLALVDGCDVHSNRRQNPVGLPAKNDHFALIARLQHTARFR